MISWGTKAVGGNCYAAVSLPWLLSLLWLSQIPCQALRWIPSLCSQNKHSAIPEEAESCVTALGSFRFLVLQESKPTTTMHTQSTVLFFHTSTELLWQSKLLCLSHPKKPPLASLTPQLLTDKFWTRKNPKCSLSIFLISNYSVYYYISSRNSPTTLFS